MSKELEERMATLEAEHRGLVLQLIDIKSIVVNLRDNHLAHLAKDLTALKIDVLSRPSWLITSVVAVLSSAVVGLLVALVKK